MSLLAELKRRKVFRVAIVYAATAFAVLQGAEILLPNLGVPEWPMRFLVAVVLLGFPLAVVLAWALEIKPDGGIQRIEANDAAPGETPPLLGRRTLIVSGLLVVLGIGLSAGWLLKPGALQPAKPAAVAESGAPDTPAKAPARGIGVLPFANLSPDPDNAFFAGGVHEEVLARLSLIPELRVISRTSMEKIAGDGLEVSEIGRRLGVSHVLEGSVRRAGDRVRVTVQLIEAATDQHIWAENFDRTLDDTFTIQSEIALAIAAQLEASLNPELRASIEARPTDNPEAYDLYLRAREQSRIWSGAEGFRRQIELLEQAVALDPEFLPAKLLLTYSYGQMHRLATDAEGGYDRKALDLVTELRRRWPERRESRMALAHYQRLVERNFELALAEFQTLLAAHPNDVEIMQQVATTLKWLYPNEEFLKAQRRVLALDPENSGAWREMLIALRINGHGDEHLEMATQAIERFPTDPNLPFLLALGKLAFHGDREAMLTFGRSPAYSSLAWDYVAVARFADGDVDGALEIMARPRAQAVGLEAAVFDVDQAEFLRLAGRDAEAEAPARRAHEALRDWIDSGRPAPGGNDAFWFAIAARAAALAGEREAALAWQARALAMPLNYWYEQAVSDLTLARSRRWLGDPDAAWALIEPHAGMGRLSEGELLGLQPYYDALYGEAAGYRAYMKQLRAEWGR